MKYIIALVVFFVVTIVFHELFRMGGGDIVLGAIAAGVTLVAFRGRAKNVDTAAEVAATVLSTKDDLVASVKEKYDAKRNKS